MPDKPNKKSTLLGLAATFANVETPPTKCDCRTPIAFAPRKVLWHEMGVASLLEARCT